MRTKLKESRKANKGLAEIFNSKLAKTKESIAKAKSMLLLLVALNDMFKFRTNEQNIRLINRIMAFNVRLESIESMFFMGLSSGLKLLYSLLDDISDAKIQMYVIIKQLNQFKSRTLNNMIRILKNHLAEAKNIQSKYAEAFLVHPEAEDLEKGLKIIGSKIGFGYKIKRQYYDNINKKMPPKDLAELILQLQEAIRGLTKIIQFEVYNEVFESYNIIHEEPTGQVFELGEVTNDYNVDAQEFHEDLLLCIEESSEGYSIFTPSEKLSAEIPFENRLLESQLSYQMKMQELLIAGVIDFEEYVCLLNSIESDSRLKDREADSKDQGYISDSEYEMRNGKFKIEKHLERMINNYLEMVGTAEETLGFTADELYEQVCMEDGSMQSEEDERLLEKETPHRIVLQEIKVTKDGEVRTSLSTDYMYDVYYFLVKYGGFESPVFIPDGEYDEEEYFNTDDIILVYKHQKYGDIEEIPYSKMPNDLSSEEMYEFSEEEFANILGEKPPEVSLEEDDNEIGELKFSMNVLCAIFNN